MSRSRKERRDAARGTRFVHRVVLTRVIERTDGIQTASLSSIDCAGLPVEEVLGLLRFAIDLIEREAEKRKAAGAVQVEAGKS